MKNNVNNIIVLVACAVLFGACGVSSEFTPGAGNKFQYNYKLVYPIESSSLLFQDDNIIIQFKFDEAAIRFQLQNITSSKITITWNKASININGRYFPIRNSNNLYSDTVIANSIIIPPLGYIRDLAIPRENIYYDGDNWVEKDLLPTIDRNSPTLRDAIQNSIGQRIGLLFPINFGSNEHTYEFDFVVDSVKRIPWKEYIPTKRIPSPPPPKKGILGLDNVTTAIVVVGILGFSAYIISMKKNPPSE